MKTSSRDCYLYLLTLFVTFLLYGCGGPLNYAYVPTAQDNLLQTAEGHSIYIAPIEDQRKNITSENKIGDIHTTVMDISGSELVLSRRPALITREALITEFEGNGFKVFSEPQEDAEYLLKARLKKFSLDVASQDIIEIALHIEIFKTKNNKSLWVGTVETSGSRYAGVSGDSRRSLSAYISTSLAKVMEKALSRTEAAVKKDIFAESSTRKKNEKDRGQGYIEVKATGHLRITTVPPRAKIYLNKIYYGLSPQALRLRPGIYELVIKKDGFVDFREKIAVGSGRTTEMETTLTERE